MNKTGDGLGAGDEGDLSFKFLVLDNGHDQSPVGYNKLSRCLMLT